MKRNELIDLLDELFPQASADVEDSVGLQVKGKEEVKNVLVTLDITLDVINTALENDVDMIIAHHPLFFAPKEEWFKNNPFQKAKYELLEKMKINVFIAHTNADYAPNSLAYNQALALDIEKVDSLYSNKVTMAKLDKEESIEDLTKLVKTNLELDYEMRTNSEVEKDYSKLMICTGTCGWIVNLPEAKDRNTLLLVGEMKHHEWVYANEHGINVLEIGHYSEKIFKDVVQIYLEENAKEITVLKSKEENGYK